MAILDETGVSVLPPSEDASQAAEMKKRKGVENFFALRRWHEVANDANITSPFVIFDEATMRNAIILSEDVFRGVARLAQDLATRATKDASLETRRGAEWLQNAVVESTHQEEKKQQAYARTLSEQTRRSNRLFGDATEMIVLRQPIQNPNSTLDKTYIGLANNGAIVGFRGTGADSMEEAMAKVEHPGLENNIAPWTPLNYALVEAKDIADQELNKPVSKAFPAHPITAADIQMLINGAIDSVKRQSEPIGIRVPSPPRS